MKKLLMALLVLLLLLGCGVGLGLYSLFGHNRAPVDGEQLGRATVVLDLPYVSEYLVDAGNGKYVLIDGGADQEGAAAKAALAERDASEDDLLAVVLTHGHGDHVGAAYAFKKVPLYAPEADVPLVEGTEAPGSPQGELMGPNPPGLKVTNTFKGGDKLMFGDVVLEVFDTPGHTRGNSAFLLGDVMILGDTAQVMSDDTLHSPPDVFTRDPAQAIESIRKLGAAVRELPAPPKVVVGSHSGSTSAEALTGYTGDAF